MSNYDLWNAMSFIGQYRFIDLTHTFTPGIPHAVDMPDEQSTTLFDHPKDDFQAHQYTIAGQWGTHCDPPIHFVKNGRTIDEISPSEMIAPLVVFDVRKKVQDNPDYSLTVEDITDWERTYGYMPDKAFVVLQTGWAEHWNDPSKFHNLDAKKIKHTPGWSKEAVDFLCTKRSVIAFGHETLDSDPGILVSKEEFPAEIAILGHDKYQIEALASLREIPPAGSVIIATFPKPKAGSGFPARVFAIVP